MGKTMTTYKRLDYPTSFFLLLFIFTHSFYVIASEIYKKDYVFTVDLFSRHVTLWDKKLSEYKNKEDLSYLEIGVFEGSSLFWMLENILTNPTAKAVAVDPFFDHEEYPDIFYSNLKASGFDEKVTIIKGLSQVEVRKLPLNKFDIVYIDGSHIGKDVLADLVNCWFVLKVGGIMICDDYKETAEKLQLRKWHKNVGESSMHPPKPAVDCFVDLFEDEIQIVHCDRQIMLKKIKRIGFGL